ncbi:MAG: hypothetical protein ACO331_16335 [Prochlorothrix sp.]
MVNLRSRQPLDRSGCDRARSALVTPSDPQRIQLSRHPWQRWGKHFTGAEPF